MKKKILKVIGHEIILLPKDIGEFISLTDIAKYKDPERSDYVLQNWMRNRSTIEFIGLWEKVHNPNFNPIEFDGFRGEAGSNSFSLTPKRWIERTKAIGIQSRSGRYGGTYAHCDIAFEFATWISPEFKLYLIIEFQRLKKLETDRLKDKWSIQRTLAKVNYRIHTDAIKEMLIPSVLSRAQIEQTYANEADILNVALFGLTAAQWRKGNPEKDGNVRDHAMLEQLIVLSNLESINAMLIHQGLAQSERLQQLNAVAIKQMTSLIGNPSIQLKKFTKLNSIATDKCQINFEEGKA